MRESGGQDRRMPGADRRGAPRGPLAAIVLGCCLVACSGAGDETTPPVASAEATEAVVPVQRNIDGHLRLGVWLPSTGAAAVLGNPLLAGVELAVEEINASGGVNGKPVVPIETDEGSDPATAYKALDDLLAGNRVDAIIGPASSRVALGALDKLADARVLTCSPTAAALELDERLDGGYFIRTIGSETLEAVAFTQAMIATGDSTFAVLYPDDDYGLAFADRIRRAFSRRRAEVTTVPYDPTDEQFNVPAQQALAGGTEVVGVVGTGALGAKVLAAVAANGGAPNRVPTFVTDGLRTSELGGLIDPRRPMASTGIQGVSPYPLPRDTTFEGAFARVSPGTPVTYAAYAYDCVNLLAVAAQAAGSDDPQQIRSQLAAISSGGFRCQGFAECAEQLSEGRNIDLDGASGDLELAEDGDVSVASYDLFRFDDNGRDMSVRTLTVRDETG